LQLIAIGISTFQTNLLTIPACVLFILQLLFWTWLSEKINERFLVGLASQIWALPLLIALELIPANASHWSKRVVSSSLVGAPYIHALLIAITSRSAEAVRTRTVASAFYNITVQASKFISNNASERLQATALGIFVNGCNERFTATTTNAHTSVEMLLM
jgi:hypothetical protein